MLTLRSASSHYLLVLVMDELARQLEEDVPWDLLPDELADGILLVKMSLIRVEFLFGIIHGCFIIKRLSKEIENVGCNFGEFRSRKGNNGTQWPIDT